MMAMMIGVVCRQCNPTNKVLIVPTRNTTKWYVRRGTNICYASKREKVPQLTRSRLPKMGWIRTVQTSWRERFDDTVNTSHMRTPTNVRDDWPKGSRVLRLTDVRSSTYMHGTIPYGIQCITVPLVFIMHGNLVWAKLLCYATKIHSTL